MRKAVSDTGPPLHLGEIRRLVALTVCGRLLIPQGVVEELQKYRIWGLLKRVERLEIEICEIADEETEAAGELLGKDIQDADLEVLALARAGEFVNPVLTDDLALRQTVEKSGGLAVGSFGLLVRAYRDRLFSRRDLKEAVDSLMDSSSLHMSRPFRAYATKLVSSI